MDGLSLASDESMILTLQDIISHGIRIEVILTSKRLILVESGKDRVQHEDIQFETISSVIAGENSHREPTITLSLTSPAGETRTDELIFFRRPGIERVGERDLLIVKLKGYISPALVQEPHAVRPLSGQGTGVLHTTPPGEGAATMQQGRDWTPRYSPYSNGSPPPDDPPVGLKFNAITVIIIILVVVVGGALIYSQFMKGKPAGPSGSAAIPTVTTQTIAAIAPSSPTIQPATKQQGTEMASSVPQVIIPNSGVWVRVQSPGSFIGSVGSRPVNASGDKFYQIPMRKGIIDVSIQKQEGSGNELAVEIYKDGSLVKRSNTTAPKGTIDLHISL